MTRNQIISELQTNADFALMFGIDNNPEGVIAVLKNAGFNGGTSKQYAYQIMSSLIQQGKVQEVVNMFSQVRYIDTAPNYTGGFKDFFLRSSPPQTHADASRDMQAMRDSGFSWGGVLAGLGAGLATYAGIALGGQAGNQGSTGSGSSETEDTNADGSKKTPWKKILLYGGIGVGVVLVIVGLIFAFRKKPEDTKKD